MAKKKAVKKKKTSGTVPLGRRGLWKGSIAFGLVNIPVQLFSSSQGEQLSFNMIDKRDHARIGYKQINKSTGEEVDRSQIVKGFQYERGEYVLLDENDFAKANVKATRTIDIEDFVMLKDVDVIFFDKPYYVMPQKGGEKGYALLRKILERTGKTAIAKIVLHKNQHLAALIARGDYIVLELLRFADEVIDHSELAPMDEAVQNARISDRELDIAEQLVEGMTSEWTPSKYKDTYREDLMKMIENKIKKGNTASVNTDVDDEAKDEVSGKVLDLTALLKKSLSAKPAKKKPSRSRSG